MARLVRERAPVLRSRLSTCFSTVRGDRCSWAAISLLGRPSATSRSTSASRAAPPAFEDGWGDPVRWLTSAEPGFGRRGLDRLADRCRELRNQAQPNPWLAAGVTTREAQVLRLVAAGLPNKEIAARLHLSPRTVEKHVESLLRKTGARSRTSLALEHGSR